MNIEETKKAIEVMKAFCDGKQIQYLMKFDAEATWEDYKLDGTPVWSWDTVDYRIKPEKHIRPYTFAEMCKAVKKHGVLVKSKVRREVFTITGFDDFNVFYANDNCEPYNTFLTENVWFDDNSPCGIEEE